MRVLTLYIILINAAGFLIMLIDKQNAISRRRRVPEAVLQTIALVGGSIGSIAAMWLLRHKTRKALFQTGFYFSFVLNVIFLYLLSGG